MTAPPEAAEILAVRDATWAPLERRPLGGWVLRRGGGGGRRISSVWVRGAPDRALAAALDAVVAQARAWGQPPYFQIGEADAALDAALADRGWRLEVRTRQLRAPVAPLARRGAGGRMVVRLRGPLAAAERLWDEGGVGPAHRAAMARVTVPKETLLLREDDRPAALVFVATAGATAMLHALYVAPRFRRHGLGGAATAAAAAVAAEQGAEWITLAVEEANAPARALYAGLGFEDAGWYLYRRGPEPSGPDQPAAAPARA
jgi:GNAT superfamily N-acetyltransferase